MIDQIMAEPSSGGTVVDHRQALMVFEQHKNYALTVGRNFAFVKGFTEFIDLGAIDSSSLIALWNVCKRFDESKRASFHGYLVIRVKGQIIDDIRQYSHPRRWQPVMIYIDDTREGQSNSFLDAFHDERQVDPSHAVNVQDIKVLIEKALRRIPIDEAKVVRLYFFENMKLAEIGVMFGFTESRACQLLNGGKRRLRLHLSKLIDFRDHR